MRRVSHLFRAEQHSSTNMVGGTISIAHLPTAAAPSDTIDSTFVSFRIQGSVSFESVYAEARTYDPVGPWQKAAYFDRVNGLAVIPVALPTEVVFKSSGDFTKAFTDSVKFQARCLPHPEVRFEQAATTGTRVLSLGRRITGVLGWAAELSTLDATFDRIKIRTIAKGLNLTARHLYTGVTPFLDWYADIKIWHSAPTWSTAPLRDALEDPDQEYSILLDSPVGLYRENSALFQILRNPDGYWIQCTLRLNDTPLILPPGTITNIIHPSLSDKIHPWILRTRAPAPEPTVRSTTLGLLSGETNLVLDSTSGLFVGQELRIRSETVTITGVGGASTVTISRGVIDGEYPIGEPVYPLLDGEAYNCIQRFSAP